MNATHDFQPAGVEFPFSLKDYLFTSVTPFFDHVRRDTVAIHAKMSAGQKARYRKILKQRVEFWSDVFSKVDNIATTSTLAGKTGYELRSVSKALENIMGKTTYVERKIPSRQEIKDFNIPYNNRMGCYIWKWYSDGHILEEWEKK